MAVQMSLHWPSGADQRITVPYHSAAGSVDIYAPLGTAIRAVMSGNISVTAGNWLQISSEQMVATYIGLQNIKVQPGQNVNGGDVIAESGSPESIKLLIYQNINPTDLFEKPAATASAPAAQPAAPATVSATAGGKIYLTPTRDAVRVREKPVDGNPVGQLKLGEIVESLEAADVTRGKVGVDGQWLNIRRYDGSTAYTAAWFLQISDKTAAAEAAPVTAVTVPTGSSLLGMNLDIYHPQGHPSADAMKGIGWARIKFNVSFNPANNSYGNKDIEGAYQRYLPLIQQYASAGMKVLMVFTHQLYGEGAGFNWTQMDSGKWRQLGPTYADFAKQVAAKFKGSGLIHAYQIWNEQDTKPEHARAAVPVPAADYGYLLTETIRAIRTVDQTTPIITGGHTTGPGLGPQYAKATMAAMPPDVRPDGVALHPYGRGVKGHRFSNWGPLSESIQNYSAVMPGKPIWITEWGVLDHQGRTDVINDVTDYSVGFMNIIKNDYPGKVAAAIWYAWADSMDNGFGLVDASGKPKPGLNEKWRTLG